MCDGFVMKTGSNSKEINPVNYSLLLKTTGELDEAERTLKRALDIKKQLAESRPAIFEDKLATTLTNWGILLYERGRAEEAEEAADGVVNDVNNFYLIAVL